MYCTSCARMFATRMLAQRLAFSRRTACLGPPYMILTALRSRQHLRAMSGQWLNERAPIAFRVFAHFSQRKNCDCVSVAPVCQYKSNTLCRSQQATTTIQTQRNKFAAETLPLEHLNKTKQKVLPPAPSDQIAHARGEDGATLRQAVIQHGKQQVKGGVSSRHAFRHLSRQALT